LEEIIAGELLRWDITNLRWDMPIENAKISNDQIDSIHCLSLY